MQKINDPKTKLYLTISIIVFIIIIIWLLNFKNIIQSNNNYHHNNDNLKKEWQDVDKNFNDILIDLKQLKYSFKQSTSTTEKIQNTIKLTPDQLKNAIKNLNISSTTTSTIDTQLIDGVK